MNLGQKGVFWFTDALNPAQLIELVQNTEKLGYSAFWYPEVLGYESFALGSFLLGHTKNLIIASGIANIYGLDATATKQGQHSLTKAVRRSVPAGVGRLTCAVSQGRSWSPVPAACLDYAGLSGQLGQSRSDLHRQSTNLRR